MATTKIKTVNTDFGAATDALAIAKGTTAQGTDVTQGALRFNTTTSKLQIGDGSVLQDVGLKVPTVTSITPTVIVEDGTTVTTVTLTGTNFSSGDTISLIPDDATASVTPGTVTYISGTSMSFQCTAGQLSGGVKDPWDVRVTTSAATGSLTGTLLNALDINPQPEFDQAAGSLGSIPDSGRSGLSFDGSATDEGVPVSATDAYAITIGSLPAGLTLNTTTGEITGATSAVGSDTTTTWTMSCTDGVSTNTRQFSITALAPAYTTFNASTTWTVPTGVSTVDIMVVGGGGSGGARGQAGYNGGGGGGAGGLIYYPGVTVTPAGTVSIQVGGGGPAAVTQSPTAWLAGTDSYFGQPSDPGYAAALTAQGGGFGGGQSSGVGAIAGGAGGSGGGTGPEYGGTFGPGTQGSQPGNDGTYGFGNNGGSANVSSDGQGGASGGGGAGAVGSNSPGNVNGAAGGIGKAYTIADGSTPVYYAGGGGGGGGGNHPGNAPGGGGQGGGGAGGSSPWSGPSQTGSDGTANTGGGGGGASGGQGGPSYAGGAGGSGVVIVSY